MRPREDDVPDVAPQFLPPERPENSAPPPEVNDGSVPEPPRVDPEDLEGSHTFEGQRQPAIGVRVQQAYNWAVDADIDRRRDFVREKEELKRWLEYVDQEYGHTLGENTKRKIEEVKRKIEAHELFEQEHRHTTMKTKISNPKDMRTRKQRLGDPNGPPLQLGSFSPEDRNSQLLPKPFSSHPRVWRRVNTMWDTPRENALDFEPKLNVARPDRIQALAQHEDAYWKTTPGTAPPADNLSVRENKFYEDCKAFNNGLSGWVRWDKPPNATSEVRRLWTGDAPGNGEGCFAAERGARRAGFETVLRQFKNTENQIAAKSAILLALPPTAKELEAERRKAGADRGRLLEIRGLPPAQLGKTQGKDDPQGFMANMAQFWLKQQAVVEQARENLIESHNSMSVAGAANYTRRGSDNFVKPPHSVWGPYIWRGVNLEEEQKQDLLRQARAVKKVFDRERKIAPRTLLDHMNHFFDQGYNAQTEEPLYPPTAVDGVSGQRRLRIIGQRNRHPITNDLRRVDMIEMEWIRLILNNAMADERVLHDVQPRTSLFLLFAERLERIFNDLTSPLFPDKDTSVSIEDLIAYMASMDGPIQRPRFYPHDVKYWLDRLSEQGRCRYREDWRTYGWVQRPVYKYFPEQLIIWKDRRGSEIDAESFPEDSIYAPRFSEDLRAWGDVVRQNPPPRMNPAVETWFHQLAFRWGRTMRNLEARENQVWLDETTLLPKAHLHNVLNQLDAEYQALATPQKLDLAHVVRRTLNRPDSVAITEEDALKTIRDGIIDECVRSDSMLWPGRAKDYLDTSPKAVKTRESIWDWAKPEIRGPVKKFFSLDRWPVEIQPEAIRRKIESGEDIDPQQVWNPITEDPTPWTYYRQKSRPYQDEKVRYKDGHRRYLIGDTARQRQVIQNRLMARVAAGKLCSSPRRRLQSELANPELSFSGMGLDNADGSPLAQSPSASGGVWSRVRGMFKRKRQIDDDDDEDDILPSFKLPRIDPALVPKSVDREQAGAAPSGQSSVGAQGAGDGLQPSANLGARNPNLRIHVPEPADVGEPADQGVA